MSDASQPPPSGGIRGFHGDSRPDTERDPEAEIVRARVMTRLLGEEEGGDKVGRFTLIHRLGAGGMGVVYAAYDSELDRKVAVKLLRGDRTAASVRRAIVREARAMAKLSHPNVAHVYEVGEHDGSTFIAMEFVRGETVGRWQRRPGRHWREILEVYLQAGRGLAAAHAVGLIHGDFKPDNAMVGPDDQRPGSALRVRVLDFGLARSSAAGTAALLETGAPSRLPDGGANGERITRDGALMGTPAYMSPEQFLGEAITAKSDQFALCIALWEALWGERPFAGDSVAQLARSVTSGRLRDPGKSSGAPMRLRHALVRGLSPDAADRFDSIEALLAALEHDPSVRRRRIAQAGGAAMLVAAVAIGVEAARRFDRARTIAACEADGAEIDDVWNAEIRGRVREALLATGVPYAASTAANATPWLDRQADAWREHRTEVCMRGNVEQTWDADTVDRALWCLDERRLELASLVTQLEHADALVAATAVPAAASSRQISPCLDATVLAHLPPPPPPQTRDAVTELRAELARARALSAAGSHAAALEVATTTRERASLMQWPPLSAEARTLEGVLLKATAAFSAAETALVAGYVEAADANAWDTAASAAEALTEIVGVEQVHFAQARVWAIQAQVAAGHAGDPLGMHERTRLHHLGAIERLDGKYAEAARLHERALALAEAALGPEHVNVADALTSLGNDRFKLGEYAESAALHRRSLAIYEQIFGSEHPRIAGSLNNVAVALFMLGDNAAAEALYLRALALREATLGPDHPSVAMSLGNLASVYSKMGEPRRARPLLERAAAINERALGPDHPEFAGGLNNLGMNLGMTGDHVGAAALNGRALAIREKALGSEHPEVAKSLNNLGNDHAALGDHAKAKALHARALAIREKLLGPDHVDVARSLSNLANSLAALGELDEARPLYERALAIREEALGPDHLDVAYPLLGLATLARAQLRFVDAAALARRAIEIREAGHAPELDIAGARFALAQALWDAPVVEGRDRDEAMRLATGAGSVLAAADPGTRLATEVETWLTRHRARR